MVASHGVYEGEPGCAHCYAEGVAKRFWKGRPFEDVRFHAERLEQPLHWKRPRRVFVNSMSTCFTRIWPGINCCRSSTSWPGRIGTPSRC